MAALAALMEEKVKPLARATRKELERNIATCMGSAGRKENLYFWNHDVKRIQ